MTAVFDLLRSAGGAIFASQTQVSAVDAAVTGGTGISTGSGTGGDAVGQVAAAVTGGTGTSTGSGSGGTATGGTAGSGNAPGGTGTSVGSGSGGAASGEGALSGSISDSDIARIAAAVLAALQATAIPVDAKKMNGAPIIGDGSESNRWRGVGVPN